jgi:hypothetical protein
MLLQCFGLQEDLCTATLGSRCLSHNATHHQAIASLPGRPDPEGKAQAGKPITFKSIPNTVPFAVIVKPNESLGDLAMQCLGDFDRDRTRQIQKLNAELSNPDYIEIGQTILLPAC